MWTAPPSNPNWGSKQPVLNGNSTLSFVILRACDFFDLSCFLHIQPAVFQAPDKAVILSEALRRSIANRGLYGAESKDLGDACWQMLLGAFRPQTTPEDKKVTSSERSRGICSFTQPQTNVSAENTYYLREPFGSQTVTPTRESAHP